MQLTLYISLKNYAKSSFQREMIGMEDYQETPVYSSVLADLNKEDLLREINRLPEGYRVVFNLYIVEGYSHKEIAELLEIGESTSRSQLTKARKMLQTRLNKIIQFEAARTG